MKKKLKKGQYLVLCRNCEEEDVVFANELRMRPPIRCRKCGGMFDRIKSNDPVFTEGGDASS